LSSLLQRPSSARRFGLYSPLVTRHSPLLFSGSDVLRALKRLAAANLRPVLIGLESTGNERQATGPKISWTLCRFSVRPFDAIVKADQPAHPRAITGGFMPQYLVASYLPDDFDPSTVTEETIEEIHALNRELIAAGVRKFACGISPAANAKTVRKQPDGKVLVTDGPYTEAKEHIGGFWVLEGADMGEALAWARKGAISCDAAGEVRELLFYPDPKGATE